MTVRLANHDILIGAGLLAQLGALVNRRCPAHVYVVISDAQVAALYGDSVVARLRGASPPRDAALLTFPGGEAHKTRETWASLSDQMLAAGYGRDAAVIALGGGVAGDVAGFVAATYMRGIPFVQIPTSLLAMIDAAIGGKTGVDVPAGKNLVGAFHQPSVVIADLDVLHSLPPAQLAAGLAEAMKHGVIADAEYFGFLEREHQAILAKDPATLEHLVRRSVEIKAAIVVDDERDTGRRAVLNFGHTVGHAIEGAARYGLLHGEAVAIGMTVEARLGEALGVTARGTAARVAALAQRFGLPIARPAGVQVDDVMAAMRVDKKTRAGEIRLAVPTTVGRMHEGVGWTVGVAPGLIRDALGGDN